jgi:vanillate O-demethylase ferredoxin subunit
VPQAETLTLILPRKPGDAVEAGVIERGAPHPNAKTIVFMDAFTAEVLRFQPYATSSRGNRTRAWLQSLHMGYIGGVAGQVVLFLGVLAVPVLGYTGIRSWLRRRAPVMPESKFRRQSA